MSDIVPFERPTPPTEPKAPTLKNHFGDDDWILKMCADWRAARAQQLKNWAEHDLATGWGYLPDDKIKLVTKPLRRMHQFEYHASQCEPRTILLARELLGMCVTILAAKNEDPESTLGAGPVLEIVRNVIKSLDHLDGDMPIGEGWRRRRKAKPPRRT